MFWNGWNTSIKDLELKSFFNHSIYDVQWILNNTIIKKINSICFGIIDSNLSSRKLVEINFQLNDMYINLNYLI